MKNTWLHQPLTLVSSWTFFGSEEVQKRALDATHAALSAAELQMESTSKSLNPPQGTSLGSASSANASRLSFSNLFDKSEGHSNLQAIAMGVEGAAASCLLEDALLDIRSPAIKGSCAEVPLCASKQCAKRAHLQPS